MTTKNESWYVSAKATEVLGETSFTREQFDAVRDIIAEGMDVKRVEALVASIAASADDPERAHGAEDELYVDVLTVIASGAPDAAELAKAALVAHRLPFQRWYS